MDITKLLQTYKYGEIIQSLPSEATILRLKPDRRGVRHGIEATWVDESRKYLLRVHGPSKKAPKGSRARSRWILRLTITDAQGVDGEAQYLGKDDSGKIALYSPTQAEPWGEKADEAAINATHIPITRPRWWQVMGMRRYPLKKWELRPL